MFAYIFIALIIGVPVGCIAAVIYFFYSLYQYSKDGKAAVQEGRNRDPRHKQRMVKASVFIGVMMVLVVLLCLLTAAVMNSM